MTSFAVEEHSKLEKRNLDIFIFVFLSTEEMKCKAKNSQKNFLNVHRTKSCLAEDDDDDDEEDISEMQKREKLFYHLENKDNEGTSNVIHP